MTASVRTGPSVVEIYGARRRIALADRTADEGTRVASGRFYGETRGSHERGRRHTEAKNRDVTGLYLCYRYGVEKNTGKQKKSEECLKS